MTLILLASAILLLAFGLLLLGRGRARRRLDALARLSLPDSAPFPLRSTLLGPTESGLLCLNDRLARAGFFTPAVRRQARLWQGAALLLAAVLGGLLGVQLSWAAFVPIGAAIGTYFGLTGWLLYLRYRARDLEREIMFQLPIVLESLILLVESGLGILPAIHDLITARGKDRERNPVLHFFNLVYQLSARGMPFGKALESVASRCDYRLLRHVFLHLDISGNEGGELIPSLRSLSTHAHLEWKLSVEQRVKRLENLVVFPVFASVMGLILLTAAVPVVPLLNLKDTLDHQPQQSSPSVAAQRFPRGD